MASAESFPAEPRRLWRRLPVLVRAILAGSVVALAGTTPWALLVAANVKHWPAIPWSALVTLPYLWVFWRYLQGRGWPRSTAAARRAGLRARPLTDPVWGAALLAGMVGLAAVVAFQRTWARLVPFPPEELPDPSTMPVLTLVAILATSAAVAGTVEEAAFRGYMQGPIEERHGPAIAILVSGTLFGLAHFSHPGVGLGLVPYFLVISAVYGMLAYLTGSILPGVVLHAAGNMLGGISLLMSGENWAEAPASAAPLVWKSGPDASFLWSAAILGLLGLAALWAYRALAREVRAAAAAADHDRS